MGGNIKQEKDAGGGKIRKQNQTAAVLKRLSKNKTAMLGLIIFGVLVILAVLAPLLAPYGYEEINPAASFAVPSLEHLCGCDKFGRDIFSRLLYGARWSLGLAVCAELFALLIGGALGAMSAYFGGKFDMLLMRIIDIIQAIPSLLMAIVVSSALGGGFIQTVLALGIGAIAPNCRLMRAQCLTLRDQEFLEAAKAVKCSVARQIFKHIVPNALSPMIVSATMGLGSMIMTAASLSFIGLGVQPPTPEWGAMLTAGNEFLRYYPHMVVFPGICVFLTVLALNLFGDGLRDAIDPKLKR